MTELQKYLSLFSNAEHPEDVFGSVKDADELAVEFRKHSRVVHPDLFTGTRNRAVAEETFKHLNRLLQLAEAKMKAGTYGDRSVMSEVKVSTKTNVYTINRRIASGDICEVYGAEDQKGAPVVLKVTRSPINNDLTVNESTVLGWFRTASPVKDLDVMAHLPTLLDSFELRQGSKVKRVNVLKRHDRYFSLAQVIDAYPGGLDLRDAAWMWNRLLGALLAAHQAGKVHGAVIPEHFLICDSGSEEHNGVLIDWSYSVNSGSPLKAVVPSRKHFYPKEVLDKKPATFGSDLYMAAKCLEALLGNLAVDRKIKGLMSACWLAGKHRTQDVWELYSDFNDALRELFGPRKFRRFTMPKPVK